MLTLPEIWIPAYLFDNVVNTRFVYNAIMHILHAKMTETCALHQERFITDICLLEVFQICSMADAFFFDLCWCLNQTP